MPSSSHHNAAKVAQKLGTPTPANAASIPGSFTTGIMSDVWVGPEPEVKQKNEDEDEDEDAFDSTTALYHDAIRSRSPQHTVPVYKAPPTLCPNNRNCTVEIYDLPEGTTMSEVLDAIARHSPVGHVYKSELLEAVGHGGCVLRVARIRFKAPESASCLFQIGNQPGLGLYIKDIKVGVRFTRVCTTAYLAEGTRAVVFRGPKNVVDVDNLKRVWGGRFVLDQAEKVIKGPVGADGIQEVEWRFYEFAWGAQVAKCLFENEYGRREDCSARYGVDPCA